MRRDFLQGHLMEKFLTSDEETFKRFLIDSDDPAPSEVDNRQAYHYVKVSFSSFSSSSLLSKSS